MKASTTFFRKAHIVVFNGTTMATYIVKVSRKGQVTIPKNIREALGIKEGELLQISLEEGKVIITKLGAPRPGEPVGREEYEKMIEELEGERAIWR